MALYQLELTLEICDADGGTEVTRGPLSVRAVSGKHAISKALRAGEALPAARAADAAGERYTVSARLASWRAEVNTAGDPPGVYSGNALRFALASEAYAYAQDLASRWYAVREFRCVETPDPVSHRWIEGKGLQDIDAKTPPRMPPRRVSL